MSHELTHEPERLVGAGVQQPPEPGAEVAGPPLTAFASELRAAVVAMRELTLAARLNQRVRCQGFGPATGQTDAQGDVVIPLFQVPAGAQGFLTHCAVELDGATPSNPMTSANLWVGIYESSSSGLSSQGAVVAVGNLLDATPQTPTLDAQLPYVFLYGHPKAAPMIRGPATFYLVVDAATAARQVSARGTVYVEQAEL